MTPKRTRQDDARKFLGLPPYNTGTNMCFGDGYFFKECERRYGISNWKKQVEYFKKRTGNTVSRILANPEPLGPKMVVSSDPNLKLMGFSMEEFAKGLKEVLKAGKVVRNSDMEKWDEDKDHTYDYLEIIKKCAEMQAAAIDTMHNVEAQRHTHASGWQDFYTKHVLPFISFFEG